MEGNTVSSNLFFFDGFKKPSVIGVFVNSVYMFACIKQIQDLTSKINLFPSKEGKE